MKWLVLGALPLLAACEDRTLGPDAQALYDKELKTVQEQCAGPADRRPEACPEEPGQPPKT